MTAPGFNRREFLTSATAVTLAASAPSWAAQPIVEQPGLYASERSAVQSVRSMREGLRYVDARTNQALRRRGLELEQRLLAKQVSPELQQAVADFEYEVAQHAVEGLARLDAMRPQLRTMRTAMPAYENRNLTDLLAVQKTATTIPEIDGFIAAARGSGDRYGRFSGH